MRKPVVAGIFYPEKRSELIKEIEEKFFNKKFGPGAIQQLKDIIGAIVPHAGYRYSGYVAAHAYSKMKGLKGKTFVIIGPNHTGYGSSVAVSESRYWKTPLGKVKVNQNVAEKIVERSRYATFDEIAHLQEHSIEVQLPFLQYLFGDDFQIVPIVLMNQSRNVSKDLSEVICDMDVVVIASSDLTHYEPQDSVKEKDRILIESIKNLDVDALYKLIIERNITACGYGAISVLMEITKGLKGKIELLSHMTSGDITKDYTSVVGYASLISRYEK